jgi:hypothetical protein
VQLEARRASHTTEHRLWGGVEHTQVSTSGQTAIDRDNVLPSGISKSLVNRVAVNKTMIVTWANVHYLDFARNFANHMRRLGITNFLIGAMVRAAQNPS